MPPNELTSAAFGLVFDGAAILLARLVERGWDLPGGHLEPGENAEEAMRREVLEETGAVISAKSVFAHQLVRLLRPRPDGYRYSHPDGYQVFFLAEIEKWGPFVGTDESAEARLGTRGSPGGFLGTASFAGVRGSTGCCDTVTDSRHSRAGRRCTAV